MYIPTTKNLTNALYCRISTSSAGDPAYMNYSSMKFKEVNDGDDKDVLFQS